MPSMIDFGGPIRSGLGGATLQLNRLGNRFKMSFSIPPMERAVGNAFVAKLLSAKREGGRMEIPLIGVDQSVVGVPAVLSSDQSGRFLSLSQVQTGSVLKAGWWISVKDPASNGLRYLHKIVADAVATAGDLVTVQIEPALRFPFPGGSLVEITAPTIEGIVDGDELGWEMSLAHHIGVSFTIEERK